MTFIETAALYTGASGYVTLKQIDFRGQSGALLYYANPDPRKLHAVDTRGMQEWEEAVAVLEAATGQLGFAVFYGAYDQVHAGADITEFAGEPDYPAIRAHLLRGAALDSRIKLLWPRMRTVAIFSGDRYGGSVEWPLFAEYAVADERCSIQLSEVTLGIIPGWNGVLNVMLKSGASNALYMGQTGNKVSAERMLAVGLAQRLVDTPQPPDKWSTEPEQWNATWAEHSSACNTLLIEAALELATESELQEVKSHEVLCSLEDLFAEIKRRTDPEPYRRLQSEIAAKSVTFSAEDVEGQKALGKEAAAGLAQLGRPLAPLAVKAVADYVQQWNRLSIADLLAQFAEAGADESERCSSLMATPHRVAGVNAVLSKNPAERIPVFD